MSAEPIHLLNYAGTGGSFGPGRYRAACGQSVDYPAQMSLLLWRVTCAGCRADYYARQSALDPRIDQPDFQL